MVINEEAMLVKINFKNLAILAVTLVFGYIAILIWTADEKFPDIEVDLRDIAGYFAGVLHCFFF